MIAFLSCKLFHNVSLWSLAVEKIFPCFFRSLPTSHFHPQRAFHCSSVYLQQTLPGYLIIALPALEVVILITLRDNIYFLLCTLCSEHSKCSHSNYQSSFLKAEESQSLAPFYRFSFTFTNNDLCKVTKTAIASMLGLLSPWWTDKPLSALGGLE